MIAIDFLIMLFDEIAKVRRAAFMMRLAYLKIEPDERCELNNFETGCKLIQGTN
jgi:hypothetical protein